MIPFIKVICFLPTDVLALPSTRSLIFGVEFTVVVPAEGLLTNLLVMQGLQ